MTTDPDEKRTARVASGWRYDPGLERLLARQAAGEPDTHSPNVAIALGLYVEGKAAAKAHGYDTTGTTPTPPARSQADTIAEELFT